MGSRATRTHGPSHGEIATKVVARADADTHLTERQGEAYWYRHVVGRSRREAATEMGTSAPKVDSLERSASRKVRQTRSLLDVLDVSERSVADVKQSQPSPTSRHRGRGADHSIPLRATVTDGSTRARRSGLPSETRLTAARSTPQPPAPPVALRPARYRRSGPS
jgi:hypothetical protein